MWQLSCGARSNEGLHYISGSLLDCDVEWSLIEKSNNVGVRVRMEKESHNFDILLLNGQMEGNISKPSNDVWVCACIEESAYNRHIFFHYR